MCKIEEYSNYLESDEEFSYVLRMHYEWDDEAYLLMISIVKSVMKEYEDKDVIPKNITCFFTCTIDLIVGIVSNDLFFNTTPSDYTKDEYINLVEKRKQELLAYKKQFFSGDY